MKNIFNSKSAYVVGGAVRDRLLRRPTIDVDLTIPHGAKKEADRLAKALKGKAFVLDNERGVYRVTLPQKGNEGVQQIDVSNWQGKTFEEDLDRRDFTVNALAVPAEMWNSADWKKHLIDRHSGLNDLSHRVIRLVKAAAIKDDPLRILRAFRIAAELGFSLEPSTLGVIKKSAKLLKKPAPERIREELLKLFSTRHTHSYLLQMEKAGLLDILLPEVKHMRKTGKVYYGSGGVLTHSLDGIKEFEDIRDHLADWFPKSHRQIDTDLAIFISGFPREAHLKWALLLHDIGKPDTAGILKGRLRFFDHEYVGAKRIQKISTRFRWSNDETELYSKWTRHHMRPGNLANHPEASDRAFHRFFRDLGGDAVGQLLLSLADHRSYLSPKELIKRSSPHEKTTLVMMDKYFFEKEKVLPPKILNGYEVMKALDVEPSPIIGQLLKALTEAQAEGKVKTKQDALAFIKSQYSPILKKGKKNKRSDRIH